MMMNAPGMNPSVTRTLADMKPAHRFLPGPAGEGPLEVI